MQISATYAGRTDLGRFDKWRFTLEERIENNARVRAFYRRYFLLPKWAKSTLEGVWIALALLPLVLLAACERLIQIVLADDYAGRGGSGLVLFFAVLVTITYFHPLGWALIFMTLQFVIWLWFFNLMGEYDKQLGREALN